MNIVSVQNRQLSAQAVVLSPLKFWTQRNDTCGFNFTVDEGIKIKLPQAKAAAPQTEETITIFVDAQSPLQKRGKV